MKYKILLICDFGCHLKTKLNMSKVGMQHTPNNKSQLVAMLTNISTL